MTLTPPQRPLLGRMQTVRSMIRNGALQSSGRENLEAVPANTAVIWLAYRASRNCRSFNSHFPAAYD